MDVKNRLRSTDEEVSVVHIQKTFETNVKEYEVGKPVERQKQRQTDMQIYTQTDSHSQIISKHINWGMKFPRRRMTNFRDFACAIFPCSTLLTLANSVAGSHFSHHCNYEMNPYAR